MNAAARQLITATFAAAAAIDPTITPERTAAALDALDGRITTAETVEAATPADRVLTRDEVAKILGCSTKSVTRYGQAGIIRPLKFGANRRKAFGYSAQSVQAALACGAVETTSNKRT